MKIVGALWELACRRWAAQQPPPISQAVSYILQRSIPQPSRHPLPYSAVHSLK